MNRTKNKKNIFLTGATGLVGSFLLKVLLEKNYKVFVLSRGKNGIGAEERVLRMLKFWDNSIICKKSKNLSIVVGDLNKENIGFNKKTINTLKASVEEIFHCAAATQFNARLEDLMKVNVEGTRKLLNLGLDWSISGRLRKINYLSTAFVCGEQNRKFCENDLDCNQKINTPYEKSKFEAEKVVNCYRSKGLKIDVFRPPAIAGESSTGKIFSFNQALYQTLHILNLNIFEYFPVSKKQLFHVVCVDNLCESIVLISAKSNQTNKNYHTFCNRPIDLRNTLLLFCDFLKIGRIKFISLEKFISKKSTPIQRMLLRNNFFFLHRSTNLDSTLTNELLGSYGFRYPKISKETLLKLIRYPIKNGFLRKK